MPLASSVSKDRLSLPATIDSTTKATRPKAMKRRHSLRSKREPSPTPAGKENDVNNNRNMTTSKSAPKSPGPTPYYVVAAERGLNGENPHSPRLTRSAQKKKSLLPPHGQEIQRSSSGGVVLSFSPPDQKANRRREAQDIARKKAEFEQRVQKAKESGRYLAFSPTSGRPLQSFDGESDVQKHNLECRDTEKEDELLRLVGGQQEAIQNLKGQMNQFLIMQSKSFDEANKSDQLAEVQARNFHLAQAKASLEEKLQRLEREKMHLQDQIGELKDRHLVGTTKLEAEIARIKSEALTNQTEKVQLSARLEELKGQYLVERTRMESEINSLKRESSIRLQGLGESRRGLEEEKQKLYSRVEDLESQLLRSKDEYTDMKATQSKLTSDKEHLVEEKRRLESDLEKSGLEKQSLQQQLSKLEHDLRILQTKELPERDARYEAVVKDFEAERIRFDSKLSELMETEQKLQELRCQLSDLEKEKEEERINFQKLNEDTAKAFEKLERELVAKNKQIDDLKKEMDVLAADLEVEQQNRQSLELELQQQGDEAHKTIDELEAQADDLTAEIEHEKALREEVEEHHKQVEAEMSAALQDLKAQVSALTNDVEDERSRAQSTKDRLEQRNMEWERSFAIVKKEADRLAAEVKKGQELIEEMERQRKQEGLEAQQALREIREQMDALKAKLALADANNGILDGKLAFSQEQIKELEIAKQDASTDLVEVKKAMKKQNMKVDQLMQTIESLRKKWRESQVNLEETRAKLHSTQSSCEMARNRMASFDDREEELFRRLCESDRIRRDLHAKVMQLSGNIRVFVRIRPELPGEKEKELELFEVDQANAPRKRKHVAIEESPFKFPGMFDSDGNATTDDLCKSLVELTEPPKDRGGLKERKKKWRFGFDHVFSPSHGQEDIWQSCEALVQSAIDGFNVCIFAYGQTGSGKTYTMFGDEANKGLIHRAVEKLFDSKVEIETLGKRRASVMISVELLEIYNEKIRDLLSKTSKADQSLKFNNSGIEGSIIATTSSTEEFMRILEIAHSRRCIKATNSNAESSRSHMVITIHFNVMNEGGISRKGKLHFCDLAGSERLNKSGANASIGCSLLQETKSINSSLSVLSNVIEKLQQGNPNVPFRESKLTMLLQNSLGGNSKTLAIVCCNPLTSHFHESLCSLRFADKVNKVELRASSNYSC